MEAWTPLVVLLTRVLLPKTKTSPNPNKHVAPTHLSQEVNQTPLNFSYQLYVAHSFIVWEVNET